MSIFDPFPGVAVSTFHPYPRLPVSTFLPFPRLPAELRCKIWELAVEPRIVDVEIQYKNERYQSSDNETPRLVSHTPSPAVLHTCREARNEVEGFYQKSFSEVAGPSDGRRRYRRRCVWLALEIDIVDIGETYFSLFKPVASVIKRLRFERENSDKFFYHSEVNKLRHFVNVKEIQIVCADGLGSWHGATEDHYFPCGEEHVYLVDPEDGEMMKATDLDKMLEQRFREEAFQETYEYCRSSYWLL
jgi:hypothetical protein